MRLTPSAPWKMPAMAALRIMSVLSCGEAAVVGERDALDVAGCSALPPWRGRGVAEAGGHLDVGRDFGVLLFGERGDVDGVLDDAELEVVADLVGELDADGLLGFVGGAGDVRAEEDVVEAEVGRVLERLLAEDVEGSAGDVAGLDGLRRAPRRR
jgi:hypothetical protein